MNLDSANTLSLLLVLLVFVGPLFLRLQTLQAFRAQAQNSPLLSPLAQLHPLLYDLLVLLLLEELIYLRNRVLERSVDAFLRLYEVLDGSHDLDGVCESPEQHLNFYLFHCPCEFLFHYRYVYVGQGENVLQLEV